MRDATDDGASTNSYRSAPTPSESVEFDPNAPPRMTWSIECPSECEEPAFPTPPSALLGWAIVWASFAALVGIATNSAARYELVRWATFQHARQAYELTHWFVARMGF